MLLGAVAGAAAALPLIVFSGEDECLRLAECVLAGATAGYGITFAQTHVADKLRQLLIDLVTGIAAITLALAPALIRETGFSDRRIAVIALAIVPLLVLITTFKQWPDVRAELRHEASLGFIDDADVRPSAHPFLRLGRGGWANPHAHREFVRLANKIALRKRQQRRRPEEIARLYQLEIIKLRMQIQQMASIDRAARASAETSSDTIPSAEEHR
jgi:hypothetical protein